MKFSASGVFIATQNKLTQLPFEKTLSTMERPLGRDLGVVPPPTLTGKPLGVTRSYGPQQSGS
jgi:hypothetical protein